MWSHKFDNEISALSSKQLMERVFATIENPPAVIDDMCSFARWQNGTPWMSIGTAVAYFGKTDFDEISDRQDRCIFLGASWYFLMWFEMAICSLCEGDIQTYNQNPIGLPQMKFMFIPKITETNYKIYEQLYLHC